VLAAIPLVRFLWQWMTGGDTSGNVQSLIFGAIMAVASLLSLALGVLSDLLRTNRVLLEDQLERIKEIQYRTVDAPAPGSPATLSASAVLPTPTPLAHPPAGGDGSAVGSRQGSGAART
jgi:hypothetical protein